MKADAMARWFAVTVALAMLGVLSAGQARGQAATGTIQIVQGGTGQGTVTSRPAGIDCTLGGPDGPTGACEASFPAGTKVRLSADAAAKSRFEGWAPVTSCRKPRNVARDRIVRVEAGRTHSCQPVFAFKQSPTFLLQALPEGSGTVTSVPAGIDCTRDVDGNRIEGTCAENFPNGSDVTLTATPLTGWTFTGWRSEDPDCEDGTVTMDKLTRCTAVFVRNSP